ncbi:MAG: PDDEXK nuclease domain-containing protein [Aromatoleum sp.]|jgi:predicted nuclease of restriction endonuclease-like (RecB) superfamily|uniref:PDDEXK nuclease domain-containing protein n=1 Tax=Aromatoleum sp. TaxID=2307007 RepID=UPI002894F4DF|nr:PDDEXK nuclease domain-containing protein [Aromatoleum sp.]MDT3671793.1 PDDEXK nuclease domain-containing protein [Aromatoleum sp.]
MTKPSTPATQAPADYAAVHGDIVALLEAARRAAARSVNALMTASYWEIGRRIVEFEQGGAARAEYGKALLKRLSADLSVRFGRGFGVDSLESMRMFYKTYPPEQISESLIRKLPAGAVPSNSESLIRHFDLNQLAQVFPLSWTHYIHLIRRTRSAEERAFYEAEVLRGGWSVRQLDRQISSQFYTRALLSTNKRAMLEKGSEAQPGDAVTPDEAIKDPYVLEFLNLKDEYSESQLEDALIHRLEDFLLELGNDFTFVGRQRRLRIDESWFRVDLLFFHRRLRCLVIIDLKLNELTHADVGQMHMYCNYAREHWTLPGENPPVGLILCARAKSALARYALDGLPNKIMAAEYRTVLPDVELLQAELEKTRRELEAKQIARSVDAEGGA